MKLKQLLSLWILCLLLGCAAPNPADIRPIQQIYADRLSQLTIGMDLNDFRRILPEAYPGGQKSDVTAYQLDHKQVVLDRRRQVDAALGLYNPQNIVSDQSLWFYFYAGKLVQWGRPEDWPEHPDLIIEKRLR